MCSASKNWTPSKTDDAVSESVPAQNILVVLNRSAGGDMQRERFDVLVSDLGLPDGSGYDVIHRVRARQIVPGIAMSGYGMEEDVRRSREAGFTEHLVKPIEVSQLVAAMRRVANDRG